jgi:PII-like signaling protein
MQGFQVTFYTQQDHRHHGQPVADWLLQIAGELGLRGATVMAANEGIGHHHRLHAAHFLELAEQPLAVVMALSAEEAARLFARVESAAVQVFYVKTAVEFGLLGAPPGT